MIVAITYLHPEENYGLILDTSKIKPNQASIIEDAVRNGEKMVEVGEDLDDEPGEPNWLEMGAIVDKFPVSLEGELTLYVED